VPSGQKFIKLFQIIQIHFIPEKICSICFDLENFSAKQTPKISSRNFQKQSSFQKTKSSFQNY